ncbi:glycoside hydrolase family 3 C-terminal domain-containing protein [Pedobacter changchengzhani]|nr:glycoside hydrolase family 3 C-terminal domain-containing protein [Pedobacter changchengzhani]
MAKDKGLIYLDTRYSFKERAADLVSRMTLEEQVSQLRTNKVKGIPRLGVQEYFYWSEGQHGIYAMFGNLKNGGVPSSAELGIYGDTKATSFPVNFATSMSWDPKLMYRSAVAIADEARGFVDKSLFGNSYNNIGESITNYGYLTYWAPTINLARDPRWGRTDETFGEDPYLTSIMGAAYVNGYQGQTMEGKSETGYLKVAATAKHFALNNVENNRHGLSSNTDDETLRDYYTSQFKYIIEKAHVAGLMTSYNAVNGTPAVANTYLICDLAQRTFGFDGYITSDCGAIGTVYNSYPSGHAWAPPGWTSDKNGSAAIWTNTMTGKTISGAAGGQAYAVRAGTTLNCGGDEAALKNVEEALKVGLLSKGVLDRALISVFTIRMKTGEFDPPEKVAYTKIKKDVIQSVKHQLLATEVAENNLVLLKNDAVGGSTNKLLPLNPSKLKKVVIVGNLAKKLTLGGYSGTPSFTVSAFDGIAKKLKSINSNIEIIFDSIGTSTDATKAAILSDKVKADIKIADLVMVFVGTDSIISHEDHDRASIAMPGNYDSMIYQVAAVGNPNMILNIQATGPVQIDMIEGFFPAIMFSSYNGQSQGTALANVLVGDKNPSGHLNFTWYVDDTQLPNFSNYYLKPKETNGLGRTYMHFTGKPSFPFGYGLSYSQFKITNVQVSNKQISPNDSINISYKVTNTGNLKGETVSQLYVAAPKVKGAQLPINKLMGFQKTNNLNPGESQNITLKVLAADLGFWDKKKLKSVVNNGSYNFQVGYNAKDIADSVAVDVKGDLNPKVAHVTVAPEDLVYKEGETIDLKAKNKWIKSTVNIALEDNHTIADNLVEAVNNDGSFVDISKANVKYSSDSTSVATVNDLGIVKTVGKGLATITVTVNGVSGNTVIVVQ